MFINPRNLIYDVALTFRHLENVAELYFMEMSAGNMMEYSSWRKKAPTPEFLSFSNAYRLEKLANEKGISVPGRLLAPNDNEHVSLNESAAKATKKTKDIASSAIVAGNKSGPRITCTPSSSSLVALVASSSIATAIVEKLTSIASVKTAKQFTIAANSVGGKAPTFEEKKPPPPPPPPPPQIQQQLQSSTSTQEQPTKVEAVSSETNLEMKY